MNFKAKKTWIFQGNADRWGINEYLSKKYKSDGKVYFTVNEHGYYDIEDIKEGDDAYIWRAGAAKNPGIVAFGEVFQKATQLSQIQEDFGSDPHGENDKTLKVGIKLHKLDLEISNQFFTRAAFMRFLPSHPIVTINQGCAFSLSKSDALSLLTEVKIRWGIDPSKDDHQNESNEVDYPEEIREETSLHEGTKKQIVVNAYERNSEARKACLREYGFKCSVCEFDFEETYGELGKDYIHVHHLVDISTIGLEYQVDPKKDLRPVCPNCHAMLHRSSKPARSIEDLKQIMKSE